MSEACKFSNFNFSNWKDIEVIGELRGVRSDKEWKVKLTPTRQVLYYCTCVMFFATQQNSPICSRILPWNFVVFDFDALRSVLT